VLSADGKFRLVAKVLPVITLTPDRIKDAIRPAIGWFLVAASIS